MVTCRLTTCSLWSLFARKLRVISETGFHLFFFFSPIIIVLVISLCDTSLRTSHPHVSGIIMKIAHNYLNRQITDWRHGQDWELSKNSFDNDGEKRHKLLNCLTETVHVNWWVGGCEVDATKAAQTPHGSDNWLKKTNEKVVLFCAVKLLWDVR